MREIGDRQTVFTPAPELICKNCVDGSVPSLSTATIFLEGREWRLVCRPNIMKKAERT